MFSETDLQLGKIGAILKLVVLHELKKTEPGIQDFRGSWYEDFLMKMLQAEGDERIRLAEAAVQDVLRIEKDVADGNVLPIPEEILEQL